jgi:hypothetical protein
MMALYSFQSPHSRTLDLPTGADAVQYTRHPKNTLNNLAPIATLVCVENAPDIPAVPIRKVSRGLAELSA